MVFVSIIEQTKLFTDWINSLSGEQSSRCAIHSENSVNNRRGSTTKGGWRIEEDVGNQNERFEREEQNSTTGKGV